MYRFTVLVLSFMFYEQTVFSATVDQRQTGDYNVQIDLKNLKIIGLMKGKEEYVDYDYAYDYSEMTIKPPNGTSTTKKPLNVSETAITSDKDNTTAVTTVFTELELTTSSIQNRSTEAEVTVTSTPIIESNETSTITNNLSAKTLPQGSADTGSTNITSLSCKKGFFRNSQGNCELKLQNPSNALLKMLREKAKLNVSNGVKQP